MQQFPSNSSTLQNFCDINRGGVALVLQLQKSAPNTVGSTAYASDNPTTQSNSNKTTITTTTTTNNNNVLEIKTSRQSIGLYDNRSAIKSNGNAFNKPPATFPYFPSELITEQSKRSTVIQASQPTTNNATNIDQTYNLGKQTLPSGPSTSTSQSNTMSSLTNSTLTNNSNNSQTTKPFKCDVCNRGFSQKGNLKTHMMTHSGERPFECQVCGKNFTQKGNLDTHVKIHTDSKDHKCQYCDKSFIQRGNLKIHIRSMHTKEKPYCCRLCGKGFSQRGNMLTHFKTHDKNSKIPCNICGKTFSQKGNLKTHQLRHERAQMS